MLCVDGEIEIGIDQRADRTENVTVMIKGEGGLGGLVAAQAFTRDGRGEHGLPFLQVIGGK